MTTLKLGKKAATKPKTSTLHFGNYRILRSAVALPPLPAAPWGWPALPDGRPWGILANDRVGCCVISWSMHCAMLQAALNGKTLTFSDASALQTYSDATGYDASQTDDQGNNPTDQGTNMSDFMTFFANTGILDDSGNRHKILAHARLNIHNMTEVQDAAFIFKMPGIGAMFPDSAMTQTQNGQPWAVVNGTPDPTEGHCFGCQGWTGSDFDFDTWGMNQLGTADWLLKYADEGHIVVTEDFMEATGGTVDGFDLEQLLADAASLGG